MRFCSDNGERLCQTLRYCYKNISASIEVHMDGKHYGQVVGNLLARLSSTHFSNTLSHLDLSHIGDMRWRMSGREILSQQFRSTCAQRPGARQKFRFGLFQSRHYSCHLHGYDTNTGTGSEIRVCWKYQNQGVNRSNQRLSHVKQTWHRRGGSAQAGGRYCPRPVLTF
jgi:hypothetical protein